jgi:indolepyruvate ferredoxin oxidoreductase alpha subunit
MVYNPPPTGHVVLILDNATTAMTGQQENPSTGRTLGHELTKKLRLEEIARAVGVDSVTVIDPSANRAGFERVLRERLEANALSVIIARRPCLLVAGRTREYERRAGEGEQQDDVPEACNVCE